MNPKPCPHCGINYMKASKNPNDPDLCNSCLIKEEMRNPKKKELMDIINIVIKCPRETYAEIEEICINQGIDLTKYFMDMHKLNTQKFFVFAEESKELSSKDEKPVKKKFAK